MARGKKGIVEGAGDAAAGAAEAGVTAAKGALGAVGGLIGGLADKAAEAAGDAADAAKAAASGALDAAGDAAGAARTAASELADKAAAAAGDAVEAVGDAVAGAADTVADVAGGAVDAVKSAAGAVADGAADLADGAADAAKGALGAVTDAVGGLAGSAGSAAAATGAAVAGGAAAAAGAASRSSFAGGGDKDNSLIGGALPVLLGAVGVVLLAGGGMHLLNNKWTVPPVPEAAAPANPMAWLTGVADGLKGQFPWLTLAAGSAGTTVIASGEAADAAAKTSALDAASSAIAAVPEGANALLIDNITVVGSTDTPVGAALAGLGANPDVAACGKAFTDTMAGRTINFTTASAEISPDSARLLDALTGIGKACAAHTIAIKGHTDTVGEPAANQALSQGRATAVKAYWEGKGLTGGNITATGFGESAPLVPTPDETANEQNRRIEFEVTAVGAAPTP